MKELVLVISLVFLFIGQANLSADSIYSYITGDISDAEFVKNLRGKLVTVAEENPVRYNYYPNPIEFSDSGNQKAQKEMVATQYKAPDTYSAIVSFSEVSWDSLKFKGVYMDDVYTQSDFYHRCYYFFSIENAELIKEPEYAERILENGKKQRTWKVAWRATIKVQLKLSFLSWNFKYSQLVEQTDTILIEQ